MPRVVNKNKMRDWSQPPKSRNRKINACSSCRDKKIRCDRKFPCSNCRVKNIAALCGPPLDEPARKSTPKVKAKRQRKQDRAASTPASSEPTESEPKTSPTAVHSTTTNNYATNCFTNVAIGGPVFGSHFIGNVPSSTYPIPSQHPSQQPNLNPFAYYNPPPYGDVPAYDENINHHDPVAYGNLSPYDVPQGYFGRSTFQNSPAYDLSSTVASSRLSNTPLYSERRRITDDVLVNYILQARQAGIPNEFPIRHPLEVDGVSSIEINLGSTTAQLFLRPDALSDLMELQRTRDRSSRV